MKFLVVCSWALAASALLDAQLSVPQLGVARFSDGSVHSVRGVAANLIVDSRAMATADVASFSDAAGLTSTNGLIRLMRTDGSLLGEYQSAEPMPVLNGDSAAQSIAVWLPSQHLLLRWDGNQFMETPIDDSSFGGLVTYVRVPSKTSAQFFVVRADKSVTRISVALPSGLVTNSDIEPGAQGLAFGQQGWIVSQDAVGLIAKRANGNGQTIRLTQKPLPADDLMLEQMSNHWLHISSKSTGTNWAVYLDATKVNMSLLPPPVTEAAR